MMEFAVKKLCHATALVNEFLMAETFFIFATTSMCQLIGYWDLVMKREQCGNGFMD
jgi:hypothetical protein